MKMRNVKSEDLFPFAGEVDSGIAEIVRKQEVRLGLYPLTLIRLQAIRNSRRGA